MPEKKSRILHIQRYLEKQTDELHPSTITDILAHLADLGISANRRTVMLDIKQLVEAGVDVVCNRSRQNQYFIGERHFEAPELKLLVDAAQASKFLTAKRSRAIIDKLLSLTSVHHAESLKNGLYLENQAKPKNETAYITADLILTAINTRRRVQFMYIEYTPDKQKIYKHGRRVYELSPWVFVWNNDSYYIIGHSESHGKTAKFRVDRIAAAKLTELPAVPVPEDFDLAAYMKSVFQMYDGPMIDLTLKCENALMKTIIDRFGEDVQTEIADSEHFRAQVKVSASKTFYGWVFASDGAVEIIAQNEAVSEYRDMLNRAKSFTVNETL